MIYNTKQINRFGNQIRYMEWERQNRLRIPFEKNFKFVLKNYFKKLASDVEENYLTGNEVYFEIGLNNSFKTLSNIFGIQYNIIARAFKNFSLNRTQHTKDFDTEFEIALAQYIDGNVGTLVMGINETTRKRIQDEIANSLNNNLDIPTTSKNLRNMLIGFGLWRATLIARTEVHRTASWANEQTALQMNIAGTIKEWVAVQDDRTRITHAVADGQKQNIESKFAIGGDLLKYPGDPMGSPEETINCRCVVTYTTPDYFVNT